MSNYTTQTLFNLTQYEINDDELSNVEIRKINGIKLNKITNLKNLKQDGEIFKYFDTMEWMIFSNKNRYYSKNRYDLISEFKIPPNENDVPMYISNTKTQIKCTCDLRILIAILFIENKNPHIYKFVNFKSSNRKNIVPDNLYWSKNCLKSLHDENDNNIVEITNNINIQEESIKKYDNKSQTELYTKRYRLQDLLKLNIYQISKSSEFEDIEYKQITKCFGGNKKLLVSKNDDTSYKQYKLLKECMYDDEVFRYFDELPWLMFSNKNRIYSTNKYNIKSQHNTDNRDLGKKKVKCKISNLNTQRKCDVDLHIIIAVLFLENPNPEKYKYVLYLPHITETNIVYPEYLSWSTSIIFSQLEQTIKQLKNVQQISLNNVQQISLNNVTNSECKYVESENTINNNLLMSYENEIWYKFTDSIYPEINKLNHYYASNKGRVRYNDNIISFDGHIKLSDGKSKYFTSNLGRVIAMACNLPNPHNKPTIDHIDSNYRNNCIENLQWATYSEQNDNVNTKLKRTQKILYKHVESSTVMAFAAGVNRLAAYLKTSAKTIKTYQSTSYQINGFVCKYISDEEFELCKQTNSYVDNILFFESDNFHINYGEIVPYFPIKCDDPNAYAYKLINNRLYKYSSSVKKFIII